MVVVNDPQDRAALMALVTPGTSNPGASDKSSSKSSNSTAGDSSGVQGEPTSREYVFHAAAGSGVPLSPATVARMYVSVNGPRSQDAVRIALAMPQ